MRKIILTEFVTLDGIVQAPGGPEEDTSDNFAYGGWQLAEPSDEMMDTTLNGFFNQPFELLLGKRTYDTFASYWPYHTEISNVATPFNATKKYVVSHNSFYPTWHNSVCITGDVVEQIKKLKQEDGPDLWVWGSSNLIQTLLKHDLVDRMHLWIYPIILGTGKKLFADPSIAKKLKLVDSKTSKTGAIVATYEPIGNVELDLNAK